MVKENLVKVEKEVKIKRIRAIKRQKIKIRSLRKAIKERKRRLAKV